MAPAYFLLRDTAPHSQGRGQGARRGLLGGSVQAFRRSREGWVFKKAAAAGECFGNFILLNKGFLEHVNHRSGRIGFKQGAKLT